MDACKGAEAPKRTRGSDFSAAYIVLFSVASGRRHGRATLPPKHPARGAEASPKCGREVRRTQPGNRPAAPGHAAIEGHLPPVAKARGHPAGCSHPAACRVGMLRGTGGGFGEAE